MSAEEPAASSTARTRRSFPRLCGMNDCPEKPGFTDMTNTKSTSGAMASSADAGVAGLMHDARLRPELANERDRAMQMTDGFDVHRHHAGAGGHELLDVAIGLLDHQVHIQRSRGHAPDRPHDRGTDGDVGNEVTVHHVDVDQISAAPFHRGDVASKGCEVGGENRRRDLDCAGSHRLTSSEIASLAPTRNPPAGCCRTTVPGGTPG